MLLILLTVMYAGLLMLLSEGLRGRKARKGFLIAGAAVSLLLGIGVAWYLGSETPGWMKLAVFLCVFFCLCELECEGKPEMLAYMSPLSAQTCTRLLAQEKEGCQCAKVSDDRFRLGFADGECIVKLSPQEQGTEIHVSFPGKRIWMPRGKAPGELDAFLLSCLQATRQETK